MAAPPSCRHRHPHFARQCQSPCRFDTPLISSHHRLLARSDSQGGYDAARDAEQWLRRRLAVTDIPVLQANAHRLADLTPPSFHLITAY